MGEGSSKPGDLALGDIRTDRPFVVRMWTWRKILPFRRFHPVGCGSILLTKASILLAYRSGEISVGHVSSEGQPWWRLEFFHQNHLPTLRSALAAGWLGDGG